MPASCSAWMSRCRELDWVSWAVGSPRAGVPIPALTPMWCLLAQNSMLGWAVAMVMWIWGWRVASCQPVSLSGQGSSACLWIPQSTHSGLSLPYPACWSWKQVTGVCPARKSGDPARPCWHKIGSLFDEAGRDGWIGPGPLGAERQGGWGRRPGGVMPRPGSVPVPGVWAVGTSRGEACSASTAEVVLASPAGSQAFPVPQLWEELWALERNSHLSEADSPKHWDSCLLRPFPKPEAQRRGGDLPRATW